MKKVIEVKNLRFGYDSHIILDHIDFTVYQGDFAGIIGSNGTGKSTLLKLLLGQLPSAKGTIRLLGEPIHTFEQWPKIGYVPQQFLAANGSFPATAGEIVQANLFSQIGLLHWPQKQHKEKALKALETVGMQDYSKRLIGNLSGGQQQRVMIAKALVNEPEILLLDEPTSGIDSKNAEALYDLLKKLNMESGITIIMVTHDVSRASGYVNRLICLEEGSCVELSRKQIEDELLHKHKHPPQMPDHF